MKERIKRKNLSFAAGILVVLAIFAGIMIISAAAYIAGRALYSYGIDIPYAQYAQYVVFIVLGVYIVRNWITEYDYEVSDSELIVDRLLGSRQRNLLRLRLDSIVSINKTPPLKCPIARLTFRSKKSGGIFIVYCNFGKEKCAYLTPNADMIALIKKRTGLNNQR